MVTLSLLLALAGLAFYGVATYNGLVSNRNKIGNDFAQIDVQLTRRYDLIPNLVEAVKGHMQHERSTLDAVINARNAALSGLKTAANDPSNAEAIKALGVADANLTGNLGKLFALAESYPDLKAGSNMLQLQEELGSTENKVAFSRQAFNEAVLNYNNAREVFPGNIVAEFFNFTAAEYLEIESVGKRAVPSADIGQKTADRN